MTMQETKILPLNVTELSQSISQSIRERAKTKSKVSLAIPGGGSPKPLLKSLAKELEENHLSISVDLYFVDERYVPQNHEYRNDEEMMASWGEGGALPGRVFSMPLEGNDIDEDARAYGDLLLTHLEGGSLDITLLGIGPDGHFASLFPGHPGLKEESICFAVTDSPKPPPRRITLSLPFINHSREILVLITGSDKGRALRKGLKDPEAPLAKLAGHAKYFLNEDAMKAYLD